MLALTRHPGESIIIGNEIAIYVQCTERDRVRLGILAPQSVPVHRHEIFRRIHELPADIDDPVRLIELYRAARTGRPHPALTDGRG